MEEDLLIEQREALQIEVPQEARPLSLTNPSTRIQTIVEEDLRLGAGEFGIWRRLDDERNDDNHLLIHQPEEGNWVTLQALLLQLQQFPKIPKKFRALLCLD